MIKKIKLENNNFIKIKEFLDKYPDIFDSRLKMAILHNARLSNGNVSQGEVLREVYDYLGLLPDNKNIYVAFRDLVTSIHDIKDKNIIEVGGGHLPCLAKKFEEQGIAGKITVYDPKLSKYEENTDKLKLKREKFTKDTPVEDTDLIIGLMPCEAATEIIDSAIKNKKDFVIALCEGGPHGDIYDWYESDDEWLACTISQARHGVETQNLGKLVVKEKVLSRYNDDYPVIYNKREK